MRPISFLLFVLATLALFSSPAAAQTAEQRMSACEGGRPGVPLVGTVTDAESGAPIFGAVVIVDDYPLGMTDSIGCYDVIGADEIRGGRRRVEVHFHRYDAADTIVQMPEEGRSDTVHFALRPSAPGCCRLQGEWSIRLTMLDRGETGIKPRADEVEGRMVFSDRLPSPWEEWRANPHTEHGRFDVDLGVLFGGPYAPDVSTTVFGHASSDFLIQAAGEVLSGDSVMITMIPGMSHGGLSLAGTIRGDSVTGRWIQNAYCCGATGRFVMRRVPPSPAGDSLVERGVRAMAEAREEAEREEADRAKRIGYLRLRVFDEGAGRYAEVAFAAEGHEDNPGGGTSSIAYRSGEDGWGRRESFEPGRYDLLIYEYSCNGATRMGNWVDPDETTPRWTVAIESGRQVDLDIRVDLCALPHETWVDEEDADRVQVTRPEPPAAVPSKP